MRSAIAVAAAHNSHSLDRKSDSNLMDEEFVALFTQYSSALLGDVSRYADRSIPLVLPRPEPSLLSRLFTHAHNLFELEPILLQIPAPCIVVGDIHGQVLDLFRILNTFGVPGEVTYLFLGDLVDRGEFSIEALITVFLLKVLWPDRVFLIRGNHEFDTLCSTCGFMSQMQEFFQMGSLYDEAIRAFSEIPIAALIGASTLCVHGGIGPALFNAASIEQIRRPIDDFADDLLTSLVWSDPDSTIDDFAPSQSRGAGYAFGERALAEFLDQSRLSMLVRAHECVPDGVQESFHGRLITVFSASNYCGLMGNKAAILEVKGPRAYNVHTFPPLPWLLRSSVQFGNSFIPAAPSLRRGKAGIPRAGSDMGLPAVKARVGPSASASSLPRLAPAPGMSPLAPGEPAPIAQGISPVAQARVFARPRVAIRRGSLGRDCTK
jgi:protein phosphatase